MTIRIWHIVFFAAALIVAGVSLAPAQLLFRGSEGVVTFQRAEGTIWNSTLRHVDLGGLDGGEDEDNPGLGIDQSFERLLQPG